METDNCAKMETVTPNRAVMKSQTVETDSGARGSLLDSKWGNLPAAMKITDCGN